MPNKDVRLIAGLVCGTTLGLVSGLIAANANSAKTTWTTFMYQGPGSRFAVIDEVPEASSVELFGCADGWCKVNYGDRIGYLPAEIIARGDLAKPATGILAQPAAALGPVPSGPCFKANQKGGNGGNAMTVFCQR